MWQRDKVPVPQLGGSQDAAFAILMPDMWDSFRDAVDLLKPSVIRAGEGPDAREIRRGADRELIWPGAAALLCDE